MRVTDATTVWRHGHGASSPGSRAGVCKKLHQIASGEEPAKEAAGHAAVQLHVEGNGLKALVHPDITKETFESHRAIVNYLAV